MEKSESEFSKDNHDQQEFDPKVKITPFNVAQLYDEFKKELLVKEAEELQLFQEFQDLVEYFQIWANTMHKSDSDRAHKRLKTRLVKVELSEEALEDKRQHYINVVDAFQQALRLLNKI